MSLFQILLTGIGVLFILSSYFSDLLSLSKKGFNKVISIIKFEKKDKVETLEKPENISKYPVSDAIISWESLSDKIKKLGLVKTQKKLDELLEFMISEHLDGVSTDDEQEVQVEKVVVAIPNKSEKSENSLLELLGDK